MPGARVTGFLGLLLIAVVSGCGGGRPGLPATVDPGAPTPRGGRLVLPVQMNPGALTPPRDATGLATHEKAVRGIAAILARDLGLPVPDQVTVYVYATRRAFEQGLVGDAHVSTARAAELSEFAIGIGQRRQLLLNDEGTQRNRREWLRLIAHELSHVCQIEAAQGEGLAEQWLAEGMAEWVAFTVLERLGLDTVGARRRFARTGIRDHGALVAVRLDLETLGSPQGFTVRHLREGSLPTYQLAFLMADYLIARNGLPAVLGYFRAFATSHDRHRNFAGAFGQTLEEFEREVLVYLKSATA
jgi:hypothetical protein